LWIDETLRGLLTLRVAEGAQFSKHHLQLLVSITRPLTIALANALAHDKIKRFNELLAEYNRFLCRKFYLKADDEVIGRDAGMSNVMQRMKQVAPLNNTVLLLGETGTGKEVIANAIHFSSAY